MPPLEDPRNGPRHHECSRGPDFDNIYKRLDRHDEQFGEVLREASAAHQVGRRVLDETLQLRGDLRDEREARLRECSIRHRIVPPADGAPRVPLSSLDYSEMTDTGIRRVTEHLDAENAILASKIDQMEKSLASSEVRAAAAEAKLAERDRQSERARELAANAEKRADAIDDKRWTKAQKIGAGIVALLTAGGGGAVLVELIARMIGAR